MSTLPLFPDPASPLFDLKQKLRAYQDRGIKNLRQHVRDGRLRILLVAPTGCHARGQLVMMFDGSLREIETVDVGDLLMGPDSLPRTVLNLCRGHGRMHRVVPVKGKPWIVNEDHVLTLVRTNADRQPHRNGELVDVTVREWLTWSKWQKHIHKLFRVSVDFQIKPKLPVDPYFLGVYLGDGWSTSTDLGIAVGSDVQLDGPIIAEATRLGSSVRRDVSRGENNVVYHLTNRTRYRGINGSKEALCDLGLHQLGSGEKFIPEMYLTASGSDRLQILAGLLDTDGSLSRSGYDFISKSRRLSDGVAFLARSLGLSAYVQECRKGCQTGVFGTYWRVSICGETAAVPCRIPRKKAPARAQKKDALRTGFSLEPAGEDHFYGFTLDGDGRYLLDDFTVTHNSGKMTIVAAIIRTSSVPVLFVCDAMELIDQAVTELAKVGVSNVGVIRGDDDRTNPSASVQVCSIQTLRRRDKPEAGLVLIDEAHLSASESYETHVFEYYRHSIIIGFTATPVRLDNKPLGNRFQVMEIIATYSGLIKEGFIAEPLVYSGPAELDLSSVKISGGDYDEGMLGDVMRDKSLVGQLVDHWKRLANQYTHPSGHPGLVEGPYRRTFIYAVGIQHSRDIESRFAEAGVRIAHLDGTTPEKERKSVLAAIAAGELDAITSVGVLLKGVDIPSVKCIVHARPTQSLQLWRQSCGRGLRPWHPGCRPGCREHLTVQPLILDHAGNVARHGFPHEDLFWSLTESSRRLEKKLVTRICKSCFAYLPAYKKICPYCGAEAPPPPPDDLPRESEEKLQQLASSPEEMRRMYFNMITGVAKARGYKPGFAGARYKQRYGAWPPWEWSEAIKASFASDPVWQANFAENQKKKLKRAEEQMAKELAKIEEPDDE